MKPCPHFLKRFAVLAAASLILSAVTLSASAAAAPVKYEEKRSTVTTVDGAQKKEDTGCDRRISDRLHLYPGLYGRKG